MVLIIKLLGAILGLTVPGYLTARMLRLPAAWPAAFPFSSLLLTLCIVLFSIAGIPLRFGSVVAALSVWSAACLLLLALRARYPVPGDSETEVASPAPLERLTLCFAILVIAATAFRAYLYPLSGFDTFIRWDALARQMLLNESLAFYPPLTAADYGTYLLPDGIPPVVATVYWWLYAASGETLTQMTAIPVTLQLMSAMALVFYGTSLAFGRRAGYCALFACASSSMVINGFAIGQETGFTSLSVVGQFCCAWYAVQRPRAGAVIAAAMFAALGALSRDYGPALALTGILAIALHAQTRRYLWLFAVVAGTLSLPWYVRTWVQTGNPLFPRPLMGLFPVNEVYEAPQQILSEKFSFYRYTARHWLGFLGLLVSGAPLAIAGGLFCATSRWKDSAPLIATSGVLVIFCLLSMGVTGDAGAEYSMLLLTPALMALAILAGNVGADLAGRRFVQSPVFKTATAAILLAVSVFSLASALAHPFPVEQVIPSMVRRHSGAPEFCADSRSLAEQLQNSTLPSGGVLTSNAYFGVILQQETRFRPMMTWNPAVRFVFDPGLGKDEVRKRLLAQNVRVVYLDFGGGGAHNQYFAQFPFFQGLLNRQGPEGFRLVAASGNEALFALSD